MLVLEKMLMQEADVSKRTLFLIIIDSKRTNLSIIDRCYDKLSRYVSQSVGLQKMG